MPPITTFDVPGYGAGLPQVGVPKTNDFGGVGAAGMSASYKFPPVLWMLIFLVGGYVGLRLLMD